jgi:hypothetical protein
VPYAGIIDLLGDRMRRTMARFYQPDLSTDLDSPFIRDGEDKLIRRSYWLDMDDRTLVMVMSASVRT